MKKVTRFISLLLFIALSLSLTVFALPITNPLELANKNVYELSDTEITLYSRQIADLNNSQFDEFIADLVSSTSDYTRLQETLNALGIELSDVTTYNIQDPGNMNICSMDYADIMVYSTKKHYETMYHLCAAVSTGVYEYLPGSWDVITMYFDTDKASYYGYYESDHTSLRQGQYATSGTVVFNFDDALTNDYNVVATYVTPIESGWLNYGADWTHTWLEEDETETFSTSLSFGGTGIVTGSIGCSVTVSTNQYYEQMAATNAVELP